MPAISAVQPETQPLTEAQMSPRKVAVVSVAVAILGLSIIAPSAITLWGLWTTDALKSVGMVVPVVSLALILRAWKGIGWRAEGTWWGLLLLLAALLGTWVEGGANLVLMLSPEDSRTFPPSWLVLLVYGAGVVLLSGGVRLLRAALFPVLMLVLANPIPHAFSLWVDLPLQRVSAEVARSLAIHLGHPLTPDHLRLMFTPDFGMFIAPGCNGLRGSMTMGLIALVAGYFYRFRWAATGLVTIGAILLGYVFNLLRLCFLLLYYIVALHFPSLQNKAEQADYVIGAGLFLFAAMLLFSVIHWLRDRRSSQPSAIATPPADEAKISRAQWMRFAAMSAMAIAAWFTVPQALAIGHAPSLPQGLNPFPRKIGQYALQRTWNETGGGGMVVYLWAQYSPIGGGTPIAIGMSPVSDWHNPLICHSLRAETPVWEGQVTAQTAAAPVEFSSALYNDGVNQMLESTTLCGDGRCGEFVTRRTHFGFIYNVPRFSWAKARPGHSTRVLLKAENANPNQPTDVARAELAAQTKRFLAATDLNGLTRPLGK
ncbi:MAG TPA: exosortase J [Acidobacteriaceae bacterium]|nr:exosortase J [Acidobacteriaceae bacterium]